MQDFLDELDQELSGKEVSSTESQNENKSDTNESITQTQKTEKQETKQDQDVPEKHGDNKKPQQAKAPQNNHLKKNFKNNYQNRRSNNSNEVRGKFNSNFPETKFYLPSLREGYTRFIPIGGNNETGAKNMGMVQYKEDIIIIDCGVQFADADLHGVDYSIPDVSFLTKYKDKIKGLLLTHAHLDHIGSLKHILPALGMPVLYGTKLTLGLAKKSIEEAGLLHHTTFVEIDAGSREKIKIGEFDVEFFKVNHSIPDCAGIYIESPGGAKFVHTGDFKIDHTPAIDDPADLDRIAEIGKRGVTMLLSDSTGSPRKGFSMSEKDVGEALDEIVKNHTKGRLIIAAFSSWISRVQQLIDICEKYDKTIFLSGRSMIENIAIAKDLGYLRMKPGTVKKMTPKATNGILPHNQVIITTGSQGEEFSALTRMSEGKHAAIEIVSGDTVVFSSSTVPGNEKSVVGIINKLIKLGAHVITKEDKNVHTGGHAFQEEQKIIIDLVKPKYFMPVYGDLYFRTLHKRTAVGMGFNEENVLLLENGNIVDFAPNGTVFRSRIKAPIQELIIDGHGMGTATSHVIKAREQMKDSGVLVVLYKVDKKTKALLGHIKLETRGLVYLEEVRHIHRMIIKKSRDAYENTIKDVPDMEEKDLVKIIRTDLEKFLLQRMDRTPMIIPLVVEV
ncbi:ribonuclease J [Candidatus Gracilibacteria bacterium 28_42_T64]|nr:ribonuclease J [Candidatus Gracilibacteria bacterium 28_42_T64]